MTGVERIIINGVTITRVEAFRSRLEDAAALIQADERTIAEAFAKLADAEDEWRAKNEVSQSILNAAWYVSERDEPQRIGQHAAWLADLNCNQGERS